MSNFNEVKYHLIMSIYDEPIGLWSILTSLEQFCPELGQSERRVAAIKIIREMMEDGLIIAGLPGKREFDRWEGATDEVIERIEREWDEILKQYSSEIYAYAFVWFAATEKGHAEGKKIEDEEM